MLTFTELASHVAKQEGKKHNAAHGDQQEIIKIVLQRLALESAVDLGKLLGKYVKSRKKNFSVE